MARIKKAGGAVKPLRSKINGKFIGPDRVWLSDSVNVPGLAMSRSIGDYLAHTAGVTAEPEVTEYALQPDDLILVIGSDGLFEFLSNEEIAYIVTDFYNMGQAEAAANAVVSLASDLWKQNEDTIDDITCVVVFMDSQLIAKNISKSDQEAYERPDFSSDVRERRRKAETMLEDILTEDNIIIEEEDE